MAANGVTKHLTRVLSSLMGFKHGLKTSKAIFAGGKLKVKPQRGEAVSKTSDAADQVNASVSRAEMLPTVHSHWSSQLIGA